MDLFSNQHDFKELNAMHINGFSVIMPFYLNYGLLCRHWMLVTILIMEIYVWDSDVRIFSLYDIY